jgi:hypothetical protein
MPHLAAIPLQDAPFRIDRAALHAPFNGQGNLSNADVCHIIWQEEESLQENAAGDVKGNNQRRALQPVGQKYVIESFGNRPLEITDIRAGSCVTTLTHLLKNAQMPMTIHILEAQKHRRDEYAAHVRTRANVKIGKIYKGLVTDFTKPPPSLLHMLLGLPRFVRKNAQDVVLLLHSLHSLKQSDIYPALRYGYSLVKPGGKMIVTYARQDISAMGRTCLAYFEKHDAGMFEKLSRLYAHKKALLADGEICNLLDGEDKNHHATIETFTQNTHTFRATAEKLCYSMMMTELLPPDPKKSFAPAILDFAADYLEQHIEACGIARLPDTDADHPGGWQALQPQQIAIITKNSKV